ncbi:MAG: hypothetical protein LBP53_04925 [Candidatus Peribacteria bacterium]|jgi:SpoVK/Ycf46/Vps4 family AAA+-type ATPase|nr:hypothetical protein [Candidatus Peribacteria bacterium]
MYLRERPLEGIDFEKLTELTNGTTTVGSPTIGFSTGESSRKFTKSYVASDIQVMCDNFARKALSKSSPITMEICEAAIKDFTPSIAGEDLEYYKSFIEGYQRV